MIKSWRHKGLKRFFETGSTSGIQAHYANVIRLILFQLSSAIRPEDMNTPGNSFHSLVGDLKGFYSVKINKNWRIIFQFEGVDAILVDYIDYH